MKRIKKNLKRYIAFLAVLIILVSITVTPANAAYSPIKQRISAMIASALLSAEVILSPILAPAQQMYDFIPDALGIPTATWDDNYLDRSKVQIWPDYTEIDGITYTDIWFSNEAAEKFRTDAFDFITQNSIISNSNGTFVSGDGYIDGIPVYSDGQNVRSVNYSIPYNDRVQQSYQIGDHVGVKLGSQTYPYVYGTYTNESDSNLGQAFPQDFPLNAYVQKYNSVGRLYIKKAGAGTFDWPQKNLTYTHDPFDFDWTSGTIPANTPLPSDTGMMIRVPSDTPGLQTFITNNIDFTIDGGIDLDFNLDPTLEVKIDDLLDILAPIIPYLDFGDVQFIINHEAPVPPVQDTLLPDTFWSQVEYKFDQIINAIQNFSLQPVIQAIQTIPSTIQTIGGNIINTISDLGNTILQDIEQGPIKVIDKALDKLKSIFLPILINLKNALGIWHYVVEWINGISAPFTWIFGIVQGGMSFIMVPIYATIAGWIVIMVYKRFGR